ncbi:MAG: hypothetical protein IKQ15_11910 [Kiritimatiellae bacterium]|nr:hypothetical protein [Kiritimatiellia bacterium]
MNGWCRWMAAGMLVLTGAGCDGPSRPLPEAHAADTGVPTPEEAMQVPIAKPLAPSTESWIVGSELGDAWEQAKTRVESLRQRLVEDYHRRMESGVGQTEASRDLRKEYLRWVGIHDELKAFILTCQTRGVKRELPPKLAANFKDWRNLRRESLSTGDGEIGRWRAEAERLRREMRLLRARGADAGSADWERLAERVRRGRTDVEELRGRTDALSWQYGADGQVAGLAARVADLAADWGELSAEVEGTAVRQNDRERLEEFAAVCVRMRAWMRVLPERVEAKNARIAEEKALARSRSGGHAAASRYRAALERDHTDGEQALADIKAFRKHFDDKAFGKFLRGFPEGSRPSLASHLEEVKRTVPPGRKPETYLNNLEDKALKLRDLYTEQSAIAALEGSGR